VAEAEPSIGARPVAGEFTGPSPSSYVRPGTQLRVDPEVKAPQSVPEPPSREPIDPDLGITESEAAEITGGFQAPVARSIEQDFPSPPTTLPRLPTPAVPVDAEGRELQPQQDTPQAQALKQQDDEEADLQERLQNLRVGDSGGGGAQPSQQPEFKEDEDEPDKPSGVLEDIGKAEADTAPEEEIADAIPGLGEIIGGAIGLGSLIAGVVEGSETPKAPQQPAGMPAMQTAYDSAPVIDSSDYHSL